jgi:hypothetical protein
VSDGALDRLHGVNRRPEIAGALSLHRRHEIAKIASERDIDRWGAMTNVVRPAFA